MVNLTRSWLKDARRAKQLTQKKTAQALGLPLSTYACYETGSRTPTPHNALLMSRYFGVPMAWFYEKGGASQKGDTL